MPTGIGLAPLPRVRERLQHLQSSLSPEVLDPATTTFLFAMADSTATEFLPGLVQVLAVHAPSTSVPVVSPITCDPRQLLDDSVSDLAIKHFPAVLTDLTVRTQTVAPIQLEALWHQRLNNSQAHRWLHGQIEYLDLQVSSR